MLRDVVLPSTTRNEWKTEIAPGIREKILAVWGEFPEEVPAPEYTVLSESENYNLKHLSFTYPTAGDHRNFAVMVLPEQFHKGKKYPVVVIPPGTGGQVGSFIYLDCKIRPNAAYPIDLAKRGYITVIADQFPSGHLINPDKKPELDDRMRNTMKKYGEEFYSEFSGWSIDGRRIWDYQRLLDVLDTMDFVDSDRYGTMGISLGGRLSVHLGAMDERIKVSAPIAGISPKITNVYRELKRISAGDKSRFLEPRFFESMTAPGKGTLGRTPYDYHELTALHAPKPLLIIEPYNDPYNPYIEANYQVYTKVQNVYFLYGKPERFCTLTHGDGHASVPMVRDFAYAWFERWL
jgi:dienelactone hydrolase